MASTDALNLPLKGVAFRMPFGPFYDNAGNRITGWSSPTATISKDAGTPAATTNTPVEIGSSGQGYLDLTNTEETCDSFWILGNISNSNAQKFDYYSATQRAGKYLFVNIAEVNLQTASAAAGVAFPAAIGTSTYAGGAVASVAGNVGGSVGSISGVTFPANFGDLSIVVSTGLVNITQAAADKVWGTTVRTITGGTVGTLTTLPSIPNNWITAAGIASGAFVAAVWDGAISGHTTSGTFGGALNAAGSAGDPWATPLPGAYSSGTAGFIVGTNLDDPISGVLTAIGALSVPTAIQNADALLKRDWTSVSGEASYSTLNSLRFLRNKWTVSGTGLSVFKEDGSTLAWAGVVSVDPTAEPIVGNAPS